MLTAIPYQLILHAFTSVRQRRPVTIQLVRPVSIEIARHMTQASAHSRLSLNGLHTGDSNPSAPPFSVTSSNPIFGKSSLGHAREADQGEPMDWEPSPSAVASNGGWTRPPPGMWETDDFENEASDASVWDSFAVNKQRMFAQPEVSDTGLESLLAGWGLGGGGSSEGTSSMSASTISHRQGLILDQNVIRLVRWSILAARVSFAIFIGCYGRVNSGVHGGLPSTHRALLGLETATSCIAVALMSVTSGERITAPAKVRCAIDVSDVAVRCIALYLCSTASTVSRSTAGFTSRWIVEWGGWAVLDLILCCT